MRSFFAPNIDTRGRAVRAALALALLLGGLMLWNDVRWLAIVLLVSATFTAFEAIRGWCVARACGVKTRL